jgi:serine/threonine-protein kinase
VKLADFGIAKRLDDYSSELTGTGHFVGTPKYLAPEQLSGEPATAATDLYATGVVLYEMLTGVAPFDGETPLATAVAHQTAPVPDVRAARPDVPPHVAAAVSKAMAKDPADRFQTADGMRAALAQRPPRAAPVPSGSRSAIWWIVPAVLLLAVGALAIAFGRDDDDPSSTVSSTAPPTSATAAVPRETVAPSTAAQTPAPTTAPSTNPPTTAATIVAGSIEELVALLDSNPDAFGERAEQLRRDLERIANGRGNDPGRARRLLEDARRWVESGQLNPGVLPLLDQMVGPLAEDEEDGGD